MDANAKRQLMIGCICAAFLFIFGLPSEVKYEAGFFTGLLHGFMAFLIMVYSWFGNTNLTATDHTVMYNTGFLIGIAAFIRLINPK